MKLFSPSCGLIYNMLKNSKSVTLFVIFFQKKSPRLSPGQLSKETTTITNRRDLFQERNVCFFYFYWFQPVYNMQDSCPHKLAPRGQVTKKGKKTLASNMMSRGVSLYGQNAAISSSRSSHTTLQPRRGLLQSSRPVTLY